MTSSLTCSVAVAAGADALFIKQELVATALAEAKPSNPYQKHGMAGLIERLKDVTSGDD